MKIIPIYGQRISHQNLSPLIPQGSKENWMEIVGDIDCMVGWGMKNGWWSHSWNQLEERMEQEPSPSTPC